MARILLVDDDWTNLETLSKACQFLGHQATVCDTGKQVTGMALAGCPDLIILDVHLQDLDGINVLEALRQEPGTSRIPVVFTSAGSPEEDQEVIQASGVTDYLSKPVSLAALQAVIQRYSV